MVGESSGGGTGSTPRWRKVIAAVAAALVTLVALMIVFGVMALATTSLANRLAIGIVAPGVVALFATFAILGRGNGPRGMGMLIGLAIATFITLFAWWVMSFSSGIS